MSWQTINRNETVVDPKAPPVLSEAVREKIRGFFPRYQTRRAVLLPALHIVQNTLGHLSWQALMEIAEVLDIHPSEVMDTVSFYTHFWTHPKGKKVITVCRSISCEVLGGPAVLEEIKRQLGIDEHGTSADGRYSLVTEECLAGCDHAPCMLINERMHKRVKPQDVARILADADNDKLSMPRSTLFDPPEENGKPAVPKPASPGPDATTGEPVDNVIGTTSDVREMRDAD
ncbi:MAG: NAD(P)H-dependent oxidoreductase subunit E [Phycisphaerae bacterium]|nr:NAD(P)H-dependent oxidoreductase subunit E [Phycisphaerae bacterium]